MVAPTTSTDLIPPADAPVVTDAAAAEAFIQGILERRDLLSKKQRELLEPSAPSPILQASFQAYKRWQEQPHQLFGRDFLPIIKAVVEEDGIVVEFLKETAKLTNTPITSFQNYDGTSDYGSPLYRAIWEARAGSYPWFARLKEDKNLLYAMRKIGEKLEPFLQWYNHPTLITPYERDHWISPRTLWAKWEAYTKRRDGGAGDRAKDDDKDDDKPSTDREQLQELTAKYNDLCDEHETYKLAHEQHAEFVKEHRALKASTTSLIAKYDRAISLLRDFAKWVKRYKIALPAPLKKKLLAVVGRDDQ
jgi:hypothetical protein